MRFEWDERKDQRNRARHGVGFETAALVFDDPDHLSIQDRYEGDEERWQTLGLAGGDRGSPRGPHLARGGWRGGRPHHLRPQGNDARKAKP